MFMEIHNYFFVGIPTERNRHGLASSFLYDSRLG